MTIYHKNKSQMVYKYEVIIIRLKYEKKKKV